MTKPKLEFEPSNLDVVTALFFRTAAFLTAMLGVLALAFGASSSLAPLPFKSIFAFWLVVVAPMLLGIFLIEFPKGNDWLMLRLGVATFCRTGLPLLILIFLDALGVRNIQGALLGYLSVFYLLGFLTSVWVSVAPIRVFKATSGDKRAVA